MPGKKPVVLVILDGWGEWEIQIGNPLAAAHLPTIDRLNAYYPKVLLQASGVSVGLPWGVCGNSEVGHQTIGSGQIIYQYLPTIDAAICTEKFTKNEALMHTFEYVKTNKSKLHIMGLASDGGVHSHIHHLYALLELAKDNGITEVYIHPITDGRDTPPQSAKKYINDILIKTRQIGIGKIATITGRYYTMDRNNNWDRIERAYRAFTSGTGTIEKDPIQAIENQYKKNINDEYFEPIVIIDNNQKPIGPIEENDAIVCFNYRKDRSRQIAKAFTAPDFQDFSSTTKNIKFTCFTQYDAELPTEIVFAPQELTTRVGEILANSGKNQLRIAETEKFAHVTYFFNGGIPEPFINEDRIFVPSKNTPSYADLPEMSAYEVTEKLINAIEQDKYDFCLVNYANPDMVGHTGVLSAGIRAVEVVDECLNKVIQTVLKKGGSLIITADHGNVEEMIDLNTGNIDTKHSSNPVPCWFINTNNGRTEARNTRLTQVHGIIADVAPTILDLIHIERPEQMIGYSLLELFDKI